ncbi:hypothetical protein IFO69_02780 [Echinicola sp. CAU 1574]|uniref:Uncharacterized protein n=1 Tax=Echinicola arenosa TaxID=2774144 RepID=A0ABR9AFP1_9BACT|nr:hypothetical protein [Echinicola arenosa]MBD8487665.1 hypothetical protein [Echinicola arenosa]
MRVRIRAVRSISDKITTDKYIDGHFSVLEAYGVTKITSADRSWAENPNVYLLVVESEDGTKVFGGGRVQIKSGQYNLPLEPAIIEKDTRIVDYMSKYEGLQVAELCGVWNSKEIAGYGIGSIFLIRAGVAVASLLDLDCLMGFCSPFTLQNCQRLGFKIIEDLGDNGTFLYPKEGLIATILDIKNIRELPNAKCDEREKIFYLKNNPVHSSEETSPKGEFTILYDLKI